MIKEYLGILAPNIRKLIPGSNLHNWRGKHPSTYFGLDSDPHSGPLSGLKPASLAALRLIAVYHRIISRVRGFKKAFLFEKARFVKGVERLSHHVSRKVILKILRISPQSFSHWLRLSDTPCASSMRGLCRIAHPSQLLLREVDAIKTYLSNPLFADWSLASIRAQMLRDKASSVSRGAFYRHTALFNLRRFHPHSRNKKHKLGLRASFVNQILHMDGTWIRLLDNTRAFIFFITDNFSRYIRAWHVCLRPSADDALACLKNADLEVSSSPQPFGKIRLVVDGGSENNNTLVDGFLSKPEINVLKQVALLDIDFSNSMSESTNRAFKYGFLYRVDIRDFTHLISLMPRFVESHNHIPREVLKTLTPFEVYHGLIPEEQERILNHQIQEARKSRILENRHTFCCDKTERDPSDPSSLA